MKTRPTIFSITTLASALSLCGLCTALAIDPPPDDSKPPTALLKNRAEPAPAPQEAAAFLGVATAPVPEMVADHLGLKAGMGVIIRTVCPDSPAEKAGLSINDIITTVANQEITGPDHFSQTIGRSNIGESIALGLIHKGKPAQMEVTLIQRPAEYQADTRHEPLLDGLPQAQADRLRGLLEQNLRPFGSDPLNGLSDSRFENHLREMREQLGRGFDQNPGSSQGFSQNSTIRLMDQEGSVEIRSSNGSTQVTVRDNSNQTVWEGPWNTEEEKNAAPQNIRERIDRVGAGKGFNFRFGPSGN